jgi:VWFA-related protein
MRRPAPPRRNALLHLLALAAVAAAVLAALAAPRAAAQGPEELPPLVEEITIEVVNVDVVVTDRRGRPVPGLTAEDFVLFEDGKRREVTNFYAFNDGRVRQTAEPAADAAPPGGNGRWPEQTLRRRMALLFDSNSLEKRDRDHAIDALERFILEQFDGTYEWSVIAYSNKLQLMQPFTDDKTTVLAALAKVRALPVPNRHEHAWDPILSESDPVVSRTDSVFGFGARQAIDQSNSDYLTRQEFQVRDRMLSILQRFDDTARAVVEAMRAFSGHDGRKSLVLVTGGLEIVPGPGQLFGRGFPGAGSEGRIDPMTTVIQSELLRRFKAIIETANAAGFAIYPVSRSGLSMTSTPYLDVERRGSTTLSGTAETTPSDIDTDSVPNVLAEGTGGEFYSTTRFYGAFDDIDDRTANSYVLGFRTDHTPDRKYHRIRVETKNDRLKIDHREGYLHLTREERLLEELSTPLAFPKDQGDFAVAMEVSEPAAANGRKVALTVAGVVPLREVTLVPMGEDMVGRMYVYVAVYDREGKLLRLFRERQDVRLPAARVAAAGDEAPARFGLTIQDLERGDYTLTLTLLDEVTDRFGTGLAPVQL